MQLIKNLPLKAMPLCALLFANLLVGTVTAKGTQNPFDDDDDPAPAPAPAPGPANPAASNQATYSCPADEGKTYYVNGRTFKFQCNTVTNSVIVATLPGNDLKKCAELCTLNPACKTTDWVAPGSCWLMGDPNPNAPQTGKHRWILQPLPDVVPAPNPGPASPGGGGLPGGDTGGMITPVDPAAGNQAAYSCPADDGKEYYTGGVTFQLKCNHGTSARHLGSTVAYTLKECADQCAANPACQSCDWNAPSGCQQKGEYIPTFPLAGQMTWFPTTARTPPCPATRSPTEIENPDLVGAPECPRDNDKSYMAPDGTYFYVKCCAHAGPGKELERKITPTYQACVDYCASVDLCKGAAYTNRDKAGSQEPLHTCILYDEGAFSSTPCGNDAHDTAFTIDPPTADHPSEGTVLCSTECPFANGQSYESQYGEVFHMDCSKRHGTKYLYEDQQATFKGCMDACARLVACHSVDYQKRTRTCYYSNHQGEPTIEATGFDSAHSMGCAGACKQGGGSCGCGVKSEL